MNSWWDLGEGIGLKGAAMEVWRLTCVFCGEKGHFKLAFHGEKKKPNSDKRLNFDVYQCLNCMGYVQVLWSAARHASMGHGLYDFKVLPWPLDAKPEPSEDWPEGMKRFWIQAHDSLTNENWDAANVMARSALQFVVREKKAKGKNLKAQIEDLVAQGVLHPLMKDWADEVRLLANASAHPDAPIPADVTPQDSKDVVNFLDLLLFYLYDLPKQIEGYRRRKTARPEVPRLPGERTAGARCVLWLYSAAVTACAGLAGGVCVEEQRWKSRTAIHPAHNNSAAPCRRFPAWYVNQAVLEKYEISVGRQLADSGMVNTAWLNRELSCGNYCLGCIVQNYDGRP